MDKGHNKRFLSVGLLCLDIVFEADHFPEEDSDQRCQDQTWVRGGNASNSCTVLSLLGESCEFFGTMAVSPEKSFLEEDFQKYGIKYDNVVYHENCKCPASVCIVNQQNGSRTILHANKNLPEVSAEDFSKIDLSQYKWIHFEGRPSAIEIRAMLQRVHDYNELVENGSPRITTSVELEKTKEQLALLQDMADYVFVSKEHAGFRGFQSPEETVEGFLKLCRPGATVICAWGERGACGQGPDGKFVNVAAYPPEKMVDTLGAGDTFNASTILALRRGYGLEEALDFGCLVAGAKCGMLGFDGIRDIRHKILRYS